MDFESQVVRSFNRYFKNNCDEGVPNGVAFRDRQAQYQGQRLDVFVDIPGNYLGIECKSVKRRTTNKLYFSQHFSEKDGTHQVEAITEYLQRSGRTGYMAILVRNGPGKPLDAYLLHWDYIHALYQDDAAGIDLRDLPELDGKKGVMELDRHDDGDWIIPEQVIQ